MRKNLVWLLIFSWILQSTPLPSQGETVTPEKKPYLAVMDFEIAGELSKDTGRTVSDKIRETLHGTNKYILVDRGNIEIIMKELAFSQTALCDQSCAVQVGRLASAQFIITGRVVQMAPNECRVTAQLTDTESTNIVNTSSESCPCSAEGIISAAETVALKLAEVPLARGTMVIQATPKSTVIFIDGNRQGKTPLNIKVPAGTHKVMAAAPGYILQEKEITIAPEQNMPVQFNLKKKWYSTWWFYTVVGTVAVGGVAAVVAGASGGGGGGGGGGTTPTKTGSISLSW